MFEKFKIDLGIVIVHFRGRKTKTQNIEAEGKNPNLRLSGSKAHLHGACLYRL